MITYHQDLVNLEYHKFPVINSHHGTTWYGFCFSNCFLADLMRFCNVFHLSAKETHLERENVANGWRL